MVLDFPIFVFVYIPVLLNVCKILNENIFVDQYFEATKEKKERERLQFWWDVIKSCGISVVKTEKLTNKQNILDDTRKKA